MILYELVCEHGHSFESWFRDSAAYDALVEAKGLSCPVCRSDAVGKALMAPRLTCRKEHDDHPVQRPQEKPTHREESSGTAASTAPEKNEKPSLRDGGNAMEMAEAFLARVRRYVESTCDDVGDRFAEEARRIHYGETNARGIYGKATPKETAALHEEGVDILSLPIRLGTS